MKLMGGEELKRWVVASSLGFWLAPASHAKALLLTQSEYSMLGSTRLHRPFKVHEQSSKHHKLTYTAFRSSDTSHLTSRTYDPRLDFRSICLRRSPDRIDPTAPRHTITAPAKTQRIQIPGGPCASTRTGKAFNTFQCHGPTH